MTFEDLFRSEYRHFVQIGLSMGASRDVAMDAANDTFLDVCRRWPELEDPRTYARTLIRHKIVRRLSKDRNFDKSLKLIYDSASTALDTGLEEYESWQYVKEILAELPPRQREVMTQFLLGAEPQQISYLLGITPAAVRQNLRYARRKLREILGLADADQIVIRPNFDNGGTERNEAQ